MEAIVEYEYEAVQDDELSLKVGDIIKNVAPSEDGWMKGEVDGKKGLFPENFVQVLKTSEKEKIIRDKSGLQKREAPQRKSVRELANKFKDGVPMGLGGPPQKKKVEKKKCKVLYEYKPENEDELELQLGDIVEFIKEVEDGWYEGTLGDKTGVFPSNFVEMMTITEPVVDEHVTAEPSSGDTSESEVSKTTNKPKKVIGVGLGNIFEGGPIKLRAVGAKKPAAPPPEKDKPPEIKESTRPPPLPPSNDIKREKVPAGEKAVVRYSYAADQPDELTLKEGDIVNVLDRHLEDDGWWKGELHGKIGVFPDNFVELLSAEEIKPKKPPPPVISTSSSSSSGSKNLFPKLPDKTDTSHDNKKHITDIKNSYKKDNEIEKGLGSVRKPNIPPPIGKKPISHKSSDAPPKLPESVKADSKSILSSNRDNKHKELLQTEEKNHNNHVNDDHVHFEELEPNSQKLVHLTANRAKGPKKRPPSSVFTPMDNDDHITDINNSSTTDNSSTRDNSEKIKTPIGFEKKPIHEPLHEIKETRDFRDYKDTKDNNKDIKESKDILLRENRDNRDNRENRESRHIPPQRPPAPDISSSSSSSNLQKLVEDLQREVRELRATTVSKSVFNELKAELENIKSVHSKKLRELMHEVDEEKKLRLNTQVEIERIKKLAETNV